MVVGLTVLSLVGDWLGRAPFLRNAPRRRFAVFGDGCSFRNTTYRTLDYASPSGEFGVPLHHPRFLEWIGVPESGSLLAWDRGGGYILCLGTKPWMRLSSCIGMFV